MTLKTLYKLALVLMPLVATVGANQLQHSHNPALAGGLGGTLALALRQADHVLEPIIARRAEAKAAAKASAAEASPLPPLANQADPVDPVPADPPVA